MPCRLPTSFRRLDPRNLRYPLVPLIFEPYARDLAARVVRFAPRTVLEIATGTGAVTSALASQLPAQCTITASDLNQPMLDRAAAKPALQGRVTFQQADALALPFEDGKFDIVACQFGAMFFPDRIKGYREARRVLKPGGHFVFNVWDEIGTNDFANIVHQSLATLFPNDPSAFMARTPHGYYDLEKISGRIEGGGLYGRFDRDDRSCEQGGLAESGGRGVLPGNSHEERDRSPRIIGSSHGSRNRAAVATIWQRRDRGPHPGARRHGQRVMR